MTDSWLLGVLAEQGYRIRLRIDFRLGPDHPEFRQPLEGEVDCFRRGWISLSGCSQAGVQGSAKCIPRDLNGFDFGGIDECEMSDVWFRLKSETLDFDIHYGSITIEFDKD